MVTKVRDTQKIFAAPALPEAPTEYSQLWQSQHNAVLRLFFSNVDNSIAAALKLDTDDIIDGSIPNSKLENSTVSFGGVTVSLGGADATPAFDLSDATNYPTSSLSGTIATAQIADGAVTPVKLSATYLQNIVEDTSPHLGGQLNGNSNSITNIGSITASTGTFSTVTGAIVTTSGNIEATGGNITAGGNIVVGGTVDGVDIAGLNTTVAGKADLSGATFTGGVSIGTLPSNPENFSVTGVAYLYGGASVTGNITVTGTVDGVDIAARDAVLTSTTTTANSAMQDLVDDTTPQLGGTLNLNGNVVTGAGTISTSSGIGTTNGDVGTTNGNLYATSGHVQAREAEIGSGKTGSFDDNYSTGTNSGSSTKVVDIGTGYHNGGTTTINIGPTSGTTTKTINLNANTNVAGNIAVTGTVDGRDVAADGAKIDVLGKFAYGDAMAVGISGTGEKTVFTFGLPAPASGTVMRSITGSIQVRFYLNSGNTPPRDIQYQAWLQILSTAAGGTSLGTATYSSSPSSYQAWYYVSGNKTDLVSPYRGRLATSVTGANYGTMMGCYYDVATNRTYIRVSKYPNATTVYANVEVFYSPTNFYSPGTYVSPYVSNYNRIRIDAATVYSTRMIDFNEVFPRTGDSLYLRMRYRSLTGTTGMSILAYNNQGFLEVTP